MVETRQEMNLKRLYNDALYWHLIHNGYTPEKAERETIIKIINRYQD